MKRLFDREITTVNRYHLTEEGKQKLLGVSLILLGTVSCLVLPESKAAGLFLVAIGFLRTAF